jgi:hypothetical protein
VHQATSDQFTPLFHTPDHPNDQQHSISNIRNY